MSEMSPDSPSPAADGWTRRQFVTAASATVAVAAAAAIQPANAGDAPAPTVSGKADLARVAALVQGKEPVTWVITGDSITQGALHCRGYRSYPEHFAERVRWELRRVRDVVINTGVSGEQMPGLLADFDWRVLRFQPGVVSAMMGMNDCSHGEAGRDKFRELLGAMVDKLRAAGAIPVLNTPNAIVVANAAGRADLPAYVQITRDVANAKDTIFVDHHAHWEKTRTDRAALERWLEDASIHPGVYGHRELARVLFQGLGIFDDKSHTCTLEAP